MLKRCKRKTKIHRDAMLRTGEIFKFNSGSICIGETCIIDNCPYFFVNSVAEWLKFTDPKKGIADLLEKHPHINSPQWCKKVLVLGRPSHEALVYAVSPIGLQLIVAATERSGDDVLNVAIALLIVEHMNGRLARSFPNETKMAVAASRLAEIEKMPPRRRGAAIEKLSAEFGKSRATLYRWKKMRSSPEGLRYRYSDGQERRRMRERSNQK